MNYKESCFKRVNLSIATQKMQRKSILTLKNHQKHATTQLHQNPRPHQNSRLSNEQSVIRIIPRNPTAQEMIYMLAADALSDCFWVSVAVVSEITMIACLCDS